MRALITAGLLVTGLLGNLVSAAVAADGQAKDSPVKIGSRLELFVDDFLIAQRTGGARLVLHHPIRREIVFRTDAPWEGNGCAYQSVFRDGDLYRMYYRGVHYRHSGKPAQVLADHPWFLCYAESKDGIHWKRPDLGIVEFNGSKKNNIILGLEMLEVIGGDPAHTAVFKDANPACAADQKYKIVVFGYRNPKKPRGLYLLGSPDGIHFRILSEKPYTTTGAFDSQNLMFWDPVLHAYREYHRGFHDGRRDILTAVSKDCLHFPKPQWLAYPGAPKEQLYTNAIRPYYRAPHILMGFPMRYTDRGWSGPLLDLPGLDERLTRAKSASRYGTAITDGVFMTSRDGITFKRWPEAFIRPGPRQRRSWVYGDNFTFWGMIETKSAIEDAPNGLSLYITEGYWEGTGTDIRRCTLRIDGFVSLAAPRKGGEVVTRPIVFDGGNLALNIETSGPGDVRVELQDAAGKALPGYTLPECPPIFGDSLRHIVRWENGGDVRAFAGRPVRLRIVLRDADLYSFQFVPYAPEPKRPNLVRYGALPPKSRDRKPFTVVDQDFQGVPAGTTPTKADLDPPAAKDGYGLVVFEGAPDRVQLLCDAPVGSGKPGPEHYLKIERRAEPLDQGGQVWVRLRPQDAADTANGVVEIDARILVPRTNAFCADIDGYDEPLKHYSRRAFHARFFPNGTVAYYHNDKHNTIPGLKFKPDTWTDVHLRADMERSRFDLTVAGKTVRGLPFALPLHRVRTVEIGPNTRNCTLFLSRVAVRVEP